MKRPLAEELRPMCFDDYVGQQHLISQGALLRQNIESGHLSSMILWGPPGVGKTSLVQIIANYTKRSFFSLSAINSGVKDVREVIEKAEKINLFSVRSNPILFIDEIHRFSKSQQDSLLAAVEKGTIILIGATTENPSFEVINPLLSRCQIYILKSLEIKDLDKLIDKSIEYYKLKQNKNIIIEEREALYRFSGGDARKLYNIIDLLCNSQFEDSLVINNKEVISKLQENLSIYDKQGEQHYDIISAFIKSVRGSDANAAVYWLARMIDGGEDIKFISRRMIILAAEDIGLANPNALLLANACFDAVTKIGMPEARIVLSETAIYLSMSAKSNSAYLAIDKALSEVKQSGNLPVPLHLRNAPTTLLKQLDYGKDYKYPHDYKNNYVEQQYLPDKLVDKTFYVKADNLKEKNVKSK